MLRARRAVSGATASPQSTRVDRCVRKFLRYFPGGFDDEWYVDTERDYKWQAHLQWKRELGKPTMEQLLAAKRWSQIAHAAVRIESRTNLLFSFEKMAVRDAIRTEQGARRFAEGLYDFLHGPGALGLRLEAFAEVVCGLPRKQTRVLTWPVLTVFGFIAQPKRHLFLKPNVTKRAARMYGYDFEYLSRPNAMTYASLLDFAATIEEDTEGALSPRDQIDLQSFIWVLGSDEYP